MLKIVPQTPTSMLALDKHAFPQTYIVDSIYLIHIHTNKKAYWVTYTSTLKFRRSVGCLDWTTGVEYWTGILEWLKQL